MRCTQATTPKSNGGTRAVPIYQTTIVCFQQFRTCSKSFFIKRITGFIYTRLNNPTNHILQERLAALKGVLELLFLLLVLQQLQPDC